MAIWVFHKVPTYVLYDDVFRLVPRGRHSESHVRVFIGGKRRDVYEPALPCGQTADPDNSNYGTKSRFKNIYAKLSQVY